jgi:hypothetical protein
VASPLRYSRLPSPTTRDIAEFMGSVSVQGISRSSIQSVTIVLKLESQQSLTVASWLHVARVVALCYRVFSERMDDRVACLIELLTRGFVYTCSGCTLAKWKLSCGRRQTPSACPCRWSILAAD